MFTYTTISNILFYCLKDTVGTVIDSSLELVNVLPGKFPETKGNYIIAKHYSRQCLYLLKGLNAQRKKRGIKIEKLISYRALIFKPSPLPHE